MTDLTITKAVQTCMACPSQWDTWDAEGNYYYLRYRSGCGSVDQYENENWVDAPWVDNPDQTQPGWIRRANTAYIRTVAEFQYGHPLDGSITLEEFAAHAGITLAPGLDRTGFWRNIKNQLTEEFTGNEPALRRVDNLLKNVNLDQE